MHGGFDSFIEEFYSEVRYLANRGYEVFAFEGPGQGGAGRKFGLPVTNEREKPVGAVLDHLKLDDVTIYGLSMGGYWCLVATAFEPRIKRVVSSGSTWDSMQMKGVNRQTELITQDVLLLVGKNDHFIPFKRHHQQTQALTAACAVT